MVSGKYAHLPSEIQDTKAWNLSYVAEVFFIFRLYVYKLIQVFETAYDSCNVHLKDLYGSAVMEWRDATAGVD